MKVNENAIRVKDMHSLEEEKARLKKMCKEMEDELQLRFDHVKDNAGSMAFNSIFPGIKKESGIWNMIIQIAKNGWKHDYVQTILFSALITFVEFLGAKFGLKYLSKLFRKSKEERDTEFY
ncbi:MAG: hypothetical protein ACRDE2_01455 [Chitinophagaceae bacterium]